VVEKREVKTVCDVCGRTGAHTWLVGTPEGERARVDLCARCDDDMRKAFVAGRRQGRLEAQGAETIPIEASDYTPSPQMRKSQWYSAQEKREERG
jgi:hypothetical protein